MERVWKVCQDLTFQGVDEKRKTKGRIGQGSFEMQPSPALENIVTSQTIQTQVRHQELQVLSQDQNLTHKNGWLSQRQLQQAQVNPHSIGTSQLWTRRTEHFLRKTLRNLNNQASWILGASYHQTYLFRHIVCFYLNSVKHNCSTQTWIPR